MSNNKQRGLAILMVLFIIFSMITFVVPFEKNAVLVIAYIFGIIAIGFEGFIFKMSFADSDAKSRFYGFPIARLGVIYIVAQLVVSLVEMGFAWILPLWVVVVVNVLIIGLTVIGLVATDTMREEIEVQDNKLRANVSNMRELQSLVNSLVGICNNLDTRKELEKLTEKFRYSDPVSSEKTLVLENELKEKLSELRKLIIDGDYTNADIFIKKIGFVLDERNRVCVISK